MLKKKCKFCTLDNKIENTIIEETKSFYVIPTLGSITDGYLLIISKKHINSMNELNIEEKNEYLKLVKKYRTKFKKIYDKYPMFFEHGTYLNTNTTASSIIHAHTHIVNHKLKKDRIKDLNFKPIKKNINFKNKNYIFYIDNKNNYYLTYDFPPISQLMRLLIAKDLNIENKFNWKEYKFTKNVLSNIEKFKEIEK